MSTTIYLHTRGEAFQVKARELGDNHGTSVALSNCEGDLTLFFQDTDEARQFALDILNALHAEDLKA